MQRTRIVGLLTALAMTGCVTTFHPGVGPSPAAFDPIAFFTGSTRGTGMLTAAFRRPERVLVEGFGRIEAPDTIVLDQTVRRGDRPPTHRRWRLTRIATGRYSGTLTDATGPVEGDIVGSRLHLAFRTKGGLAVEQWLMPEPGGHEAYNVLIVRKLGLPVARLEETIVSEPGR